MPGSLGLPPARRARITRAARSSGCMTLSRATTLAATFLKHGDCTVAAHGDAERMGTMQNSPALRLALIPAMVLWPLSACDSSTARGLEPEGCRTALQRFDAAAEAALPVVRRYGFCVSSNDGTDDCAPSFDALQAAQRVLASAAAQRAAECGSAG